MPYAEKTFISAPRTRYEIQALLLKHGADRQMFGDEPEQAVVAFFLGKLFIRMTVPFPKGALSLRQHDQLKRSRWRALLLSIKARFAAVEAGISTTEKEFLADIVTPEGQTVHQWMKPQVARMFELGVHPTQLALAPPLKQ